MRRNKSPEFTAAPLPVCLDALDSWNREMCLNGTLRFVVLLILLTKTVFIMERLFFLLIGR